MYCRKCHYDLRASDDRCPECGHAFRRSDPRSYSRYPLPRWRVLGLRALAAIDHWWIHATGVLLFVVLSIIADDLGQRIVFALGGVLSLISVIRRWREGPVFARQLDPDAGLEMPLAAPRTDGQSDGVEAFGVRFRVDNEQRFDELRALYAEIRNDKSGGRFRDSAEWLALVPDAIKANFDWPTPEARAAWADARGSSVIVVSDPSDQFGQRWNFYRVFEAFEEGDYLVLDCARVSDTIGELRIDPCFGYPYGGVGPLIALVEAFGFEVLGVNESGEFEPRKTLAGK